MQALFLFLGKSSVSALTDVSKYGIMCTINLPVQEGKS